MNDSTLHLAYKKRTEHIFPNDYYSMSPKNGIARCESTDDEPSCVNSEDTSKMIVPLSSTASAEGGSDFVQPSVRIVTFNPIIHTVAIPRLKSSSKVVKSKLWYNVDDFLSIKESLQQIIDMMDTAGADGVVGHCTHGVSSTLESIRNTARIEEARLAVFTEQQYQWNEDVVDPELLADVYFEVTRECQWEALDRGRRHAKCMKQAAKPKPVPPVQSPTSVACFPMKETRPRRISRKTLDLYFKNNTDTFSSTIPEAFNNNGEGLQHQLSEALRLVQT